MQTYKIGNEADGSTEAAFMEAVPAAPNLQAVFNGILSGAGLPPQTLYRSYQLRDNKDASGNPIEEKWKYVAEGDADAFMQCEQPMFATICASTYRKDSDAVSRPDALSISRFAYFDFDADEIETVLPKVRQFIGKLSDAGADTTALHIYATGGKGFHVLVPLEMFLPGGLYDLTVSDLAGFHLTVKGIAEGLFVDTLDMRVYTSSRMWRRENVKRTRGSYKVPISLSELMAMDANAYARIVSEPREAMKLKPAQFAPALGLMWQQAREKVAGILQARAAKAAAPRVELTDEHSERFASALHAIDPDGGGYDAWFKCVAAVNDLYGGNDEGFALVDEWSKQGRKYNYQALLSTWEGLDSGLAGANAVTDATVYAMAWEAGWVDLWPHLKPKHDVTVNEEAAPTHLTEKGAVEFIARKYADRIRYVEDIGTWIHWTGKEWAFDADGSCVHQVIGVEARRLYGQALKAKGEELQALPADADREMSKAAEGKYAAALKFYRAMESRNRIKGLKDLLPHEPAIRVSSAMLDRHPHLLNVDNGVLDLRTGALRPHDPALLLTQRAFVEYQPGATCPRWMQFVEEISCGDTDLAAYLQCVIGYALWGDISRHEAYFLHGDGSNGKSVLMNTLRSLMGGYCKSLGVDAIMVRRDKAGPTPDLLAVRGARLVITSEMSAGRQLNEGVFKDLVSGDTITVRNLYSRHVIEMQFCCKVFMPTNTLPTIAGQDYGVWRRIRAIPFNRTFEGAEKDPGLESKLKAELSGILSWALEGYQRYKAQGFNAPAVVEDKTTEYREDLDVVKHFVADALVQDEQGREDVGEIPAAILAQVYEHYCKTLNHPSMGGVRFGREVKKYLAEGKRFKSGWRYTGWRIQPEWLPAKLREEIPASRLPPIMDVAED